jgi:hypothetical protein
LMFEVRGSVGSVPSVAEVRLLVVSCRFSVGWPLSAVSASLRETIMVPAGGDEIAARSLP